MRRRDRKRQEEASRAAAAFFATRKAETQVLPPPPQKRSPMSGRKLRSFQSSLDELDSDMLEGEDAGDGQVFGKWGIKKDRLNVEESKALLNQLLAEGKLKRSR